MWWKSGISPVNTYDKSQKIFVIPTGARLKEIANNLHQKGLIKDSFVFVLLVKKQGFDNKIQAGDFRLSPSMTAYEIAETLTHGTLDVWVTIPEGKRADEIADILKKHIPSYQTSWRRALNKHEGYLFPDTYLIPKDAPIETIITLMRSTFDKRYAQLSTISPKHLTQQDIVILASLVEREAQLSKDRPLVASVLLNRLSLGMPLQIDATVQYALGFQEDEKTWWKKNITHSDLKINSLYNTYTYPGLPPTPIANPGLSALESVITPATTNYLYYISDNAGKNHYGKTLEEHNANIKKYGL